MRSISAAPDLVAGLKAARVSVVPLLSCSKYRLVSSCNHSTLIGWLGEGALGGGGGTTGASAGILVGWRLTWGKDREAGEGKRAHYHWSIRIPAVNCVWYQQLVTRMTECTDFATVQFLKVIELLGRVILTKGNRRTH